jgi:hypothetical protein
MTVHKLTFKLRQVHNTITYDVCDVTLSVYPIDILYPHRASLKNMPGHGDIIFQGCPVWIYTQINITNIIFT